MFFDGVKRTIIISAGNHKAILYAYKEEIHKFVGLFDESKISQDIIAKRYAKGKHNYSVYNLFDETSYIKKEYFKESKNM